MSTASTKSRAGKRRGRETQGTPQVDATGQFDGGLTPEVGAELSRRAWLVGCAVVMLVAALVRFYQLELRPMHHDEGVNGFFLNNLIRTGVFRYDPTNYHGPTLYYFTLPLAVAAERLHSYGTWTVRLLPLIFGLATIWLVFGFSRYLGRVGALSASALLALSPGFVFFSRYFIHEMMFVFFTLGLVWAALRFHEHDAPPEQAKANLGWLVVASSLFLVAASLVGVYRPKLSTFALWLVIFHAVGFVVLLRRYDGKRSLYLVLAAVSSALLFATKETAFISVGVLLIAWGMTWWYSTLAAPLAARYGWFAARASTTTNRRPRGGKATGKSGAVGTASETRGLVERFGGWTRISILLTAALALFLFVNILFYSSFFTNAKGVSDAVEAYKVWKKTGESGFHGYGWHKYIQWLFVGKAGAPGEEYLQWGEEPMLVLLAAAGAVLALFTAARRRFPLFAALWGFGLLAAYSLIKYKTPWLVLSMLVPFAIAGGYLIDWLWRRRATGGRILAAGLLSLALVVAACQTYFLNFVYYDDDRYIYVYAHTKREYLDMLREVERIVEHARTGYDTNINVAAPEYWPMPWYLRDYKHVGYQGRVIQTTTDAVVITSATQAAEMQARNGANYQFVGTYPMRPGVTLNLYVRRDLAPR